MTSSIIPKTSLLISLYFLSQKDSLFYRSVTVLMCAFVSLCALMHREFEKVNARIVVLCKGASL